jgi:Ni/Co efflux regulator RcnB
MKKLVVSQLILFGALAGNIATAQTPPPSTDPSAASTPAQRAATKAPDKEAAPPTGTSPSDASSPHQKQAVKKKHHKKSKATNPTPTP